MKKSLSLRARITLLFVLTVAGVGGILIAVFGGLLGVGLTILGIILWIVGRKRAQRA